MLPAGVSGPEAAVDGGRIIYCLECRRYEKLKREREVRGGNRWGGASAGAGIGGKPEAGTKDSFNPYDLVAVQQSAGAFTRPLLSYTVYFSAQPEPILTVILPKVSQFNLSCVCHRNHPTYPTTSAHVKPNNGRV